MAILDSTLGAVEIGVMLSSVLYGVATVQAFTYTQADFSDPLWLRVVVGLVWVLETVHTVLTWVFLYSLSVTRYGQPTAINDTPWYMASILPTTSLLGSIVQVFFAYRVRVLSGHLIIPIIAWSGAVLRCAFGIALTVVLVLSKTVTNFSAHYRWLVTAQFTLSAAVDVLTTLSMCIYLLRRRSGLRLTQRVVDKLLLYTVETGLVTSLCAVTLLITSLVMPRNMINWGIFMVYPKLFSNSFLTLLNSRRALRQMGPAAMDIWSLDLFTHRSDAENAAIALPVPQMHRDHSKPLPPSISRPSFEEGSSEHF